MLKDKNLLVRLGILAVVAGSGLVLMLFFPLKEYLFALIVWLQRLGVWGLFFLGAFYIVACVVIIPSAVLTLGAGFLAALVWPGEPIKGLLAATAVCSISSTAGATLAFFIGRSAGRAFIERRLERYPSFRKLDRAIGRDGFKMVALLRLSPMVPFTLLNYALSITSVRLRDYIPASWLGMLPITIIYIYIGLGLSTFSVAATAHATSEAAHWMFWVTLIPTALMSVVLTWYAKKALAEAAEQDE